MFNSLLLGSIFISLLAGQFTRIEFINGLANIYIHELVMGLFIILELFHIKHKLHISWTKYKWVFMGVGASFIIFFLSWSEFTIIQNGIAFLYLVRVVLHFLFGLVFFQYLKREKKIKQALFQLLFVFSIFLLIITSVQYIFFPNFWGITKFGWDPHLYRASGAYLDIFIAAALYGILTFFWYLHGKKWLALCFLLALVMSFSRSAYIAFMVSILYYFITYKKWKELLFVLLILFTSIIFIPKPFGEGGNLLRTASIEGRLQDFSRGIFLFQKKPLFGFGYNRIRFAKEQYGLAKSDDRSHSLASFHSSLLMILVTNGIVGLGAFLYFICACIQRHPRLRVYIIFLLSMSFFDNVLLHVLVILPFIFIAAYSSLE